MKIDKITFEMSNDFSAILRCEHCDATQPLTSGYHDNYYHTKVMPAINCRACGKDRAGNTEAHNDAT